MQNSTKILLKNKTTEKQAETLRLISSHLTEIKQYTKSYPMSCIRIATDDLRRYQEYASLGYSVKVFDNVITHIERAKRRIPWYSF